MHPPDKHLVWLRPTTPAISRRLAFRFKIGRGLEMARRDLVESLRALADKQFVEVFYEAVQGRHIYSAERNVFDELLTISSNDISSAE